jgi:hypothetical protein
MNAKERLNQKLLLKLKIAELQNDIKTLKIDKSYSRDRS